MNVTKQELKVLKQAFTEFVANQAERARGASVPRVKLDCNSNMTIANNLLDRFFTELKLPKGAKR